MAKQRPIPSVEDMEAYLHYSLKSEEWTSTNDRRYYSDLELVSADLNSRTLREYEMEKRHRALGGHRPRNIFQAFESKIVRSDESDITITRVYGPGHYVFEVKVLYNFGLHLSFLFTESEVQKSIHGPNIQWQGQSDCPLFALPKEIRDRIYEFAIPAVVWQNAVNGSFLQNAAEGLGTRGGFYFPFTDTTLLGTCRQIRTEALALAFRKTKFCLDDIDEVIQFLIAAGTVGRQNIRALEFSWSSKSDQECQWKNAPKNEEFYPTLPSLHVEECTRLLQQCGSLSSLCVKFDDEGRHCRSVCRSLEKKPRTKIALLHASFTELESR